MCGNPAEIELAIWGFHNHLVLCEFITHSFLKQHARVLQNQDGAGKGSTSNFKNQRILNTDQLLSRLMLALLCILSISQMFDLQSAFSCLHSVKHHTAPYLPNDQ